MKKAFPFITSVFVCTFAVILLTIRPAHAYIDPGTGSYIFQLAVAGLVGAGVALRLFWGNIRNMISSLTSRKKTDGEDAK